MQVQLNLQIQKKAWMKISTVTSWYPVLFLCFLRDRGCFNEQIMFRF